MLIESEMRVDISLVIVLDIVGIYKSKIWVFSVLHMISYTLLSHVMYDFYLINSI